jgi:hypothetical protein
MENEDESPDSGESFTSVIGFEVRDPPAARFSSRVARDTDDGTTVLVSSVKRQDTTAKPTDQST